MPPCAGLPTPVTSLRPTRKSTCRASAKPSVPVSARTAGSMAWAVSSSENELGRVGVVSYVERLVASPLVACTWEQTTTTPHEQHVVPDACVDLIWASGRLTVAGPDTRPRVVTLESASRLVGARLRPATAGAVLGLPASELRDLSPDAAEVLGRDVAAALLDELAGGSDPHALLLRAVQLRGGGLEPLR